MLNGDVKHTILYAQLNHTTSQLNVFQQNICKWTNGQESNLNEQRKWMETEKQNSIQTICAAEHIMVKEMKLM